MVAPVAPESLALPSPPWLLQGLGELTLAIHFLFMNVALGGTLLAAVYAVKGKARHLEAGFGLARALPFAMAYAIAFGVAPLLFVQVLYGRFFYTAAILIAPLFLAIVAALILAYSAIYFLAWRWDALKWGRLVALAVVFISLCYVGFVQANLFTLMCRPNLFRGMYLARPGGFQLNGGEATLLPRLLHFALGAIAIASLFVAMQGLRKLRLAPEQGRWQYRSGATWFAGSTVANMAIGLWWLFGLPREEWSLFMGRDLWATIIFAGAIFFAVTALVLVHLAIGSPRPRRIFILAASAAVLTVVGMVFMRATLREAELRPFYDAAAAPVSTQWGAAALFGVIFIAALVLMTYLARLAIRAFPPPEGPPLGSGGYRFKNTG
ncbi:MAG: hypothetical protein JHC34_02085 [Acidobacteria bacterium]|jgi:hypothetical protein|nr:hypothetical protein [Acidobacteriota bacterium]